MWKKKADGPSRKEAIIDSLSLPKDILLGALRVTLTGSQEAWVENYKGILEYTECQILLQGKNCQVCFEGQRLSIEYYTNEDMKISGCIRCVRYQESHVRRIPMVGVLQFLKGYVRIKVWGVSPERFLNLCSNKNI